MTAGTQLDEPSPVRPDRRERVTVIIKALNEERHIDAAIRSALAALAGIDGEVILSDSGSADRTVEIARQYPITILQLKNTAERRRAPAESRVAGRSRSVAPPCFSAAVS